MKKWLAVVGLAALLLAIVVAAIALLLPDKRLISSEFMSERLDAFPPLAGSRFVGEAKRGSHLALGNDPLTLARVYEGAGSPEETCPMVEASLSQWGASISSRTRPFPGSSYFCDFGGRLDVGNDQSLGVRAFVFSSRTFFGVQGGLGDPGVTPADLTVPDGWVLLLEAALR